MYYGTGGGPERPPPWWQEVWVLSRAVFGVLFWPLVLLFGTLIGIVALIYLFTINPLYTLPLIAAGALAIWLYSRWDRNRGVPPDLTRRR